MVIKKIIADKRPMFCCECPLLNSGIRTLKKGECGRQEAIVKGAWTVGGKVPDERCLIEVEE